MELPDKTSLESRPEKTRFESFLQRHEALRVRYQAAIRALLPDSVWIEMPGAFILTGSRRSSPKRPLFPRSEGKNDTTIRSLTAGRTSTALGRDIFRIGKR